MSIESAKAFIERMKTDEEFRDRVSIAEDQEARMAIVKAEGFDFIDEDIKVLKQELTDQELDQVAGGWSFCDFGGEHSGCF